jgi:HsdM N-terminal domain
MNAAEYKHVVLGLVFLKYISDAFEAKRAELDAQRKQGADPEDPDEYRAVNIFWVPPEARWTYLKSMAPQPTIGQLVDDAMSSIERDNPSLKGVLPKDYARPGLDKQRAARRSSAARSGFHRRTENRGWCVTARSTRHAARRHGTENTAPARPDRHGCSGRSPGRHARSPPRSRARSIQLSFLLLFRVNRVPIILVSF